MCEDRTLAERADHRVGFGGGGIAAVGVVALLVAGVVAWWVLLEAPRREIDASIALIESWGGRVDNVTSCPEWLLPAVEGTWVEGYFRWVVGVNVQHSVPPDAESVDYLAPFDDLDTLTLAFNRVDAGPILEHLPKNEDLRDVWLARSNALPDPAVVPNLGKLGFGGGNGGERIRDLDLSRFRSLRTVSVSLGGGEGNERSAAIFEALPDAPRLERLEIRTHYLADDNWRKLAELSRVRELVLTIGAHQNQLTEERVRMLAELPELRRLECHFVPVRGQERTIATLCENESLEAIDMDFRFANVPRTIEALRAQDFARLTILEDRDPRIDQPNLPPLSFEGTDDAIPFEVTLDTRQNRIRLKVRRTQARPRNG